MNRQPLPAIHGPRGTGAPARRAMHDVAIVGAGMVGAALALELARAGSDVAVVEPRAPADWSAAEDVDLRVVALAPSSVTLFERIGVWPSIAAARVGPYRRMRVWDALAPGELGFDSADDGEAVLGYIVENRLIQHALWRALQNDARVTLHCPARVEASEVDAQRRTLVLADGARINARLVVAADGGESALRGLAGIATRDRDYAQRAIVAHVTTERPHESTAWQRFLPGATIAFLPLADGRPLSAIHGLRDTRAPARRTGAPGRRSSIVWSAPAVDCERLLALDDAAFCAELGVALDFRLGRVTATTPRAAFPLRLRLAERYVAPRFALVGDAAHVVHPLAGQGVNLGLRDVDELARAIAEARTSNIDPGAESILRRYERRRRSDNAISAYSFDAIQRVFGSGSAPMASLRGAGLAVVDRIAPLKRLFARHAAGR